MLGRNRIQRFHSGRLGLTALRSSVHESLARTGDAIVGERWDMTGDGAIHFGDLIGKLAALRVVCEKCGREGQYSVQGLIERRGRDGRVTDWLSEITADCHRKKAGNVSDQCSACCPDLSRVM